MPTVSVIIPAYNCESYIAETITSVLRQTYQDFEIIVIDDGSSDQTANIAASFGPPVRLIQQTNGRVCKARNHGIREAKGQYICLLDHDDFWFPDKLERQVREFEQHPDVGIVYGSFILWHANPGDGRFPSPESYDLSIYPDEVDADFSGWIYHQFLLDCWMLTSTAMFRAEVFANCGTFDESLSYSEDWELWLRIAREYRFIKTNRPTTLYRQHVEQGNRMLRTVDYRTSLLAASVKKWGLCSRDGCCVTQAQFNRTLAKYHAEYALIHLAAGNKAIAFRSLLKAFRICPWRLKYLAYIGAGLLGWKPEW